MEHWKNKRWKLGGFGFTLAAGRQSIGVKPDDLHFPHVHLTVVGIFEVFTYP